MRDEPLGDAVHRAWAGRLLGAGWLVGAAALLLLVGMGGGRQPWTTVAAVVAGALGVVLLLDRGGLAIVGVLDAVLLATTTSVGVLAVVLPEERQTLAACSIWVVPFACALLPRRRAVLQVACVVLVDGAVMITAVFLGDSDVATAWVHWLLVSTIVVTVGLVVRRMSESVNRRTILAEAVAELGHRALGVTEPDELLREALRVAVDVLGSDYGTALRHLPDGRLRVAAEVGPDPVAPGTILLLAPAGSYARRIVQSGQPFVSSDLRSDTRVTPPGPLLSRGVVSGLAVPVLGAEKPIGVLAVHFRRRRRFTRDEVAVATALASVVATAWEQAAQRETISHLAMHDSLTGLPNRALFLDRLEHALTRRQGGDTGGTEAVAVMLIDLDDFKGVNDSLGHQAGDELLAAVAGRFLGAVRPEDTVARLGGDEFVVLCEHAPDEQVVARLQQRVQAAAAEPVVVEGATIAVTASVGVSLGGQEPGRRSTASTMLREADTALYTAKQEGRGRSRFYDEGLQVQARGRMRLGAELQRGIDLHEFVIHYQPIRATDDRRVLGVEALVRWQHPDRGLLQPGEFIPVAEETGCIVPLGRWVLQTACAQAALWQRERSASPRHEPIWLSVNLSPRQLEDPDLPHQVAATLRTSGLATGSLALELTETAVMDESPAGVKVLTRLQAAGAQLALDDFGTGYSSLRHLTRFPIDMLKVDRSFVAGLGRSTRDSAVVHAVIDLGSELGVDVIAEGVEEVQQLSMLQQAGCYAVQGCLLDRPSPAPSLGQKSSIAMP